MDKFIVFTDGSSRGNPGPGGWGAIIAGEDIVNEIGGREDITTNNRMELTAVIKSIELIPQGREISIFTDSSYVLNGSTRWIYGWQKNKWKTSKNEDVLNKDLWERLYEITRHRVIDWNLLPGHAGIEANERCDAIATSFADNKQIVLYSGSSTRYGVSLSFEKNIKKSDSKSKRSKAYSYVSKVDGVISVHKTWNDCEKAVKGKSKAKYKKVLSPEEEEQTIKEFS